jgi:hypothetical protein
MTLAFRTSLAAVVSLAVLCLTPGSTLAAPQMTLDPDAGPAGAVTRANGTGFDPVFTCYVNLMLDSQWGPQVGGAPVIDGDFSTDVTIPASTAPGPHQVIAVGLVVTGQSCSHLQSGEFAQDGFMVEEIQLDLPEVVGPVTPYVQEIDLRKLPVAETWKEGDPVRVGPGQEPEGEGPSAGSEIGSVASSQNDSTLQLGAGTASSQEQSKGSWLQARRARTATGDDSGRQEHPRYDWTVRVSKMRPGEEPSPGDANETNAAGGIAKSNGFDGVPASGVLPPDVSGDVGPDHYIQMVNARFAVYDKNGNLLAGPSEINSLWTGAGGACETDNDGDPDVRYDPIADRWLVSQFVAFTDFCIAISRTADPVTGGWYLYDFPTGGVPNDYPKFGVWPDAFYAGSQRGYPGSGSDAWAFDRSTMLAGNPATGIRFFEPGTFLLPADLDGPTPPPGTPGIFIRQVDDAQFGGVDRLEMFEFHVDFAVPANSTFTALPPIATAPFDREMCGFGLFGLCIPQPGTAQRLSAFTAWPLARLQYRNFATHESLVVNHTVDADGADHAGVRWYELRRTGGVWSIHQEGTHAPDQGAPGLADDPHRWMASVAMDKNGNLAAGYSASSETLFPSIRYSGRYAGDPLGTLPRGEMTLIEGSGSQTHPSGRWGDYASMTVDPVDDCTFWFSSEYYPATSTAGWRTRIGTFRLDGTAPSVACPDDAIAECSASGGTPAGDPQLAGFFAGATATDDCDLEPTISSDAPALFPLGSTEVTFTAGDDDQNAATCAATVTVEDTLAPTITAPPDLPEVECLSPEGTPVDLGDPQVSDDCDAEPAVENDAPALFPLGVATVTWTAVDSAGNSDSDAQDVTVVDQLPPELSVWATPSTLWPPDHKLATITVSVLVSDSCDTDPLVRLVSITSNEPDDGLGDGHTEPDIVGAEYGTDDREFQLRAERSGRGDGRVYTITYSAEDSSGNSVLAQARVTVPKSQRK